MNWALLMDASCSNLYMKNCISISQRRAKKIKLVSPRPPLLNADMVWYKKVIKLKGIQQTNPAPALLYLFGTVFFLIIYVTLQGIFCCNIPQLSNDSGHSTKNKNAP